MTVALSARADGDGVEATYSTDGMPDGARVQLLLVQNAARSDVRRGENRGRQLDHVNVVRVIETRDAGTGRVALALPDGVAAGNVFAAALVQPGDVGPILGAARADVRPDT